VAAAAAVFRSAASSTAIIVFFLDEYLSLRGCWNIVRDNFGFGFGRRRRYVDRVADVGLGYHDCLALRRWLVAESYVSFLVGGLINLGLGHEADAQQSRENEKAKSAHVQSHLIEVQEL